jgi:hypothetical protein
VRLDSCLCQLIYAYPISADFFRQKRQRVSGRDYGHFATCGRFEVAIASYGDNGNCHEQKYQ